VVTTSGTLLNKYPYVKHGSSKKYVIVFPSTGDLIRSVATNPERQIRKYRRFFPQEYSILILGYPRSLDAHNIATEIIAADFSKILDQKLFDAAFNGPAIITGISFGGKIAIPFAATYPEFVEKLIILVSAHELSPQGVAFCKDCVDLAESDKQLQLMIRFNRLYTSKFLQKLVDLLTTIGWFVSRHHLNQGSTLAHAYRYMLAHNTDTQNYLSSIKAETLVVGAERDLLFTENTYRETANRIPKGKVHIVKGHGHLSLIEKHRECVERIQEFL
jgi:pimeloyl-ACP methyl ester carboxylesterase